MSNILKRYSTAAVAAILAAAVLAGAFLFGGCKPKENDPTPTPGDGKTNDWRPNTIGVNVASDSLYVTKVENLPDDFIMGMDASCVPSLEAGGVKYYDHDGNEKDVYQILSENGINYIRVRVWNDPFDENNKGYGGGNCDIENAAKSLSEMNLDLIRWPGYNSHRKDIVWDTEQEAMGIPPQLKYPVEYSARVLVHYDGNQFPCARGYKGHN